MYAEIRQEDFQNIRDALISSGIPFQITAATIPGEKETYLHLTFGDLDKYELKTLQIIFKDVIDRKDTFRNSVLYRGENEDKPERSWAEEPTDEMVKED